MDLIPWTFFIGFGVLSVASIVVWIWALVDAIKVPDDSMYRAGNKLIWVLVIVFLQLIGAIIYLVVGRPNPGATSPTARGNGSSPPPGAFRPPPGA